METRASHLVIGSFVLVTIAGVIFFLTWLARSGVNGERRRYEIDFRQSVAGLVVGGDVRYRGIKVGSVTAMRIHPENPQIARVAVEIDSTPIRVGDAASLEMQGITGVLYVNIKGATGDSSLLETRPGERWPVIPSQPSKLESLFEDAPDLLTRTTIVMDRLGKLVSDENLDLITSILNDVNGITASIAARDVQFSRILDTFDQSRDDVAAAVVSLRTALDQSSRVMGEDVPALIAEYRQAAADMRRFVASAEAVLETSRGPLEEFADEGLGEMRMLMVEARQLLGQLRQLSGRLEHEGGRFLLSPATAEREVER